MGIIAQLRFADSALDLRSRPVADAVRRSRSLGDQGPDRPAGHGKADACLDPILAIRAAGHL
jgi:hypothetical protein